MHSCDKLFLFDIGGVVDRENLFEYYFYYSMCGIDCTGIGTAGKGCRAWLYRRYRRYLLE